MPNTLPRRLARLLLPSLILVLALAGCTRGVSVSSTASAALRETNTATRTPAVTPIAPVPSPRTGALPVRPSPTSATPPVGSPVAAPDAATTQALKDVVQRANDAQQRAFAAQDPTPMRATATAAYYAEMVQANQDLVNGGVAAIALLTLEWGPLAQQGTTGAQVTTFETWQTTYTDGSTDQARERNVYTLVQESGGWVIAADDHPDAPGNLPTLNGPGGDASTTPLPVTLHDPGQSTMSRPLIVTTRQAE